jgi:hypothetical protein
MVTRWQELRQGAEKNILTQEDGTNWTIKSFLMYTIHQI